MKYFVSAGEASGDLHASQLMQALQSIDAEASFTFLGGDKMAAVARTTPVIHYRDMAFMGFSEVLRNIGRISLNFKMARGALLGQHHDALILVDYPGFNLKLAAEAKRAGIPVYYYISPKVWAWKEYRVKQMKRLVRRLYSILPFEVEWFSRRHDYAVEYVGNPSREEVDARLSQLASRSEFLASVGMDGCDDYVVLVPGSRRGEIRNNLPVMVEAGRRAGLPMVVTAAPGIDDEFYDRYAEGDVRVVRDGTLGLMRYARAGLVTSGTATLECALAGTPQVVCYRANGVKLSYKIMEKLLKVKYVSLPNLIVDKEIVPELLVHNCTVENVSRHLQGVIDEGDVRDSQLQGYQLMRQRLGNLPAAATTAASIYSDLRQ